MQIQKQEDNQQRSTMVGQQQRPRPMIYDAPHHSHNDDNDPLPYHPIIPLIEICSMPPKPKIKSTVTTHTGKEREASCEDTKMNIGTFNLSCLAQDSLLPTSKLPFAWKLYEMLETVHRHNNKIDLGTSIVSWVDNGTAFKVHDLDRFVNDIVPTYFKQTKYKSFQRQLYFYGFQRVNVQSQQAVAASSSKPTSVSTQWKQTLGSYRHPMFIRGNKTLCLSMVPKKNNNNKSNTKRSSSSVVASRKTKTKKPKQNKQQHPQSQSSFPSQGCGPRMVSFEELPNNDKYDNNDNDIIDPIPFITSSSSSPIPLVRRRVDNNEVVAARVVPSRQHNPLLRIQQEHFYRSIGCTPPDQQQVQVQPSQQQQHQQHQQQQHPVQCQIQQPPQKQQQVQQQRQIQQPGQFYQTQYRHHQRQQQQQQQLEQQRLRRDHEKTCRVFGGKTFHYM